MLRPLLRAAFLTSGVLLLWEMLEGEALSVAQHLSESTTKGLEQGDGFDAFTQMAPDISQKG